MLTLDDVEAALPRRLKGAINEEMVEYLNEVISDEETAEIVKGNLITYASVLQEGTWKMTDYVSAVIYVGFKLMGDTNKEAYAKTFPTRYNNLIARGSTSRQVGSFVAAYNSNKLVNLIYQQSIVPVWVLNRPILQQAINTQFELMMDTGVKADVRQKAADSLMNHLKQPEAAKIEIDVKVKEEDSVKDLMEQLRTMAATQKQLIQSGAVSAAVIAGETLQGKAKDVTPD